MEQDMFTGGTNTSTMTIEWAISEILKRPETFDKATEELDRVIGRGRWVEEEDVHHLPYIEAIVKETMRIHPAAPLLVPRLSREHTTVDGYDIPVGTQVLVNVWAIGRDPAVWDTPEEFRPERFVGSPIDVKGHHFELLPFGAGRLRHPRRDAGAGERVGHRARPGRVGRSGGVPAGAVRGQSDRHEGTPLRAAALRGGSADVPRDQPRPEGGASEPGQPAARVQMEATAGDDGGGAEHG
ncbi:hypothetical protein B296_00029379 [Ensete ventricosum]|uniref:Cytochrome P450 n=1 Tax=Ensete ventricosum TaxID=4639 RepID=A0A426YJZ5_ENSVE|nr:hypothetical protein B296_00029379 [Ensete ventricosum]